MKKALLVILALLFTTAISGVFAGETDPYASTPAVPTNTLGIPTTPTSITWGWTDSSTNEDGFRVYTDTVDKPSPTIATQRTSTTRTSTGTAYTYIQSSLLVNTIYAMQVLAYENNKDSAKTAVIHRYSGQYDAATPTFSNIDTHSMTVSTANPVNLTTGLSGVVFTKDGVAQTKVQSLSSDWTGLAANTQYTATATGYNGDNVASTTSSAASKYTLALAPIFAASGDAAIDSDKGFSGYNYVGTTITFSAVNGFGTGESKASKYLYAWNTVADDSFNWADALIWDSGDLAINQATEGTYYLHLRSLNGDDVANTATLNSGAFSFGVPVPEPTSLFALGTGLIGLFGFIARRRR